jgi:hypothetical protein
MAIAQPDTELVLPCPEAKHQVNGSDRISGTHRVAGSNPARRAHENCLFKGVFLT